MQYDRRGRKRSNGVIIRRLVKRTAATSEPGRICTGEPRRQGIAAVSRRLGRRLVVVAAVLACLQGCTAREKVAGGAEPDRRNVILFVGDGMGVATVTAARIYAGQLLGGSGEEHQLPFERFPHVALIKTYNTDLQVGESAATMTAMMTGEKTRAGHVNVHSSVPRGDCAAALGNPLPTILQLAEAGGIATGIVSTTRVTHATPAATFGHSADRNWEGDADLPASAAAAGCRDLARQLVEFAHGDGIDVILAGGRLPFLPADEADPEYPELRGTRRDGRHLIREWESGSDGRQFVWNAAQLAELDAAGSRQVLGLFEPSHMQFEADRADDRAGEPSLSQMTRFAIERLRHSPRGFFLMVEGGRIDHAHHAGNAYRALVDTVAFAEAVAIAVELTDRGETLIIVTADHSHTLTISGYPRRGNPILNWVEDAAGRPARDLDGERYTTLGYANGPGQRRHRDGAPAADPQALDYLQRAAVPLNSETHAGEDVPAYATGRGAAGVRGVMEQNELFDVMHAVLFPPP